jgi:hypothetical protein
MPMDKKITHLFFAFAALLLPAVVIRLNAGHYLGFADAAEFALVTKIAGIAHAPGFPSYVIFGWLWSALASLAGTDHITAMIFFSIACTSAATLLLYFTFNRMLLYIYSSTAPLTLQAVSCISACSFFTGITAWHWSSNVEVYSFHVFCFALMLYGLIFWIITSQKKFIYIAAAGIAMALANHHLTMILFLPFLLLFFADPLRPSLKDPKKKPQKTSIFGAPLYLLIKVTALITVCFYGWMFIRASMPLPFKFGSPDSISRFIYHIAGGAWLKNTQESVNGLASLRFPYFMKITFEQLYLFLPLLIIGFIELSQKKIPKLIYITAGYYILMLLYQLRIDQTSDTDAYMLPAFFLLSVAVPFGMMKLLSWQKKLIYILPLFTAAQIMIHFPVTDKRTFDVSKTLMTELDRSAPQGSVILIADWTTVIQYYYFRIAENFRPDLVVLNYDLKFTHYRILPELYPDFYREIQPEYDRFIRLLGEAHPQEIYNTGCSLDNTELMQSYTNTVLKIRSYCEKRKVPFMTDPKAFVFMRQYDLMSDHSYVSGPLVSTINTGKGAAFLKLDYQWLNSPLLLKEPAATDKMVDLEAALDFNRNYFQSTGDAASAALAENSYDRIKQLQRKMKRNMPFVYRAK